MFNSKNYKMKKLLIICCSFLVFSACSDLTELNVNTKNPEVVPASSLIANATVELFDFLSSTNVNENNLRLWSQHWAQVSYSEESNYELTERNVNGRTFRTLYSTCARDLRDARTLVEADGLLTAEIKANQLAMIDVLEAIVMTVAVDIFGDVPYSEAFDSDNVTPSYDDDAAVYDAMLVKLNSAIETLGGSLGTAGDLIYGGNADAWKTLANSYKLRLAIRLADGDDARAKSMAEAAVASGTFGSDADNFTIAYEGSTPNTNPVWEDLVQSGRSDFVSCQTLVDHMNALDDPRRAIFFKQNAMDFDTTIMGTDTTITASVVYRGGTAGDVNSFVDNSQVGALMHEATLPGTIMGYTEVLFLHADAAERGYDVGGSAEDFYNAAVTNSILEWGGSQADADAYLAHPDVAYATAPGNWKEKIALQKWIAMYNQGFEAWSTFRIYNAPTLNEAAVVGTLPPNRYTYPVTEYSVNTVSVKAAGDAMGGDLPMSRVFWDVD